ncbi:hypothetical protein GGTG_03675 [Gaeumannomyces tritici R3-111a-1]|uniref:Uncharacterized protein n=1 Tax=Gaeumannomyces tritici (strain R3-111a-1) TaxID=644352 RepID=J3NQX0_GAET3|nr:hypothetical protein GGTG_03675 [Gaeumannomyces tritici R3-111a-1]EJT78576.1 hypothetical protein GGTG_03675 [Gaeumannomyces tritici R3-111a-1]
MESINPWTLGLPRQECMPGSYWPPSLEEPVSSVPKSQSGQHMHRAPCTQLPQPARPRPLGFTGRLRQPSTIDPGSPANKSVISPASTTPTSTARPAWSSRRRPGFTNYNRDAAPRARHCESRARK